jgi:hypothetical protein
MSFLRKLELDSGVGEANDSCETETSGNSSSSMEDTDTGANEILVALLRCIFLSEFQEKQANVCFQI